MVTKRMDRRVQLVVAVAAQVILIANKLPRGYLVAADVVAVLAVEVADSQIARTLKIARSQSV